MILLAQEEAAIQPMGWVLIIGFLVCFILGVFYDKMKAKKFKEEIDKKFEGQIVDGNEAVFITPDRELVIRFAAGNVSGYDIYKLDAVKYVMVAFDNMRGHRYWVVGLYDEKKRLVKGSKYASTKKKPGTVKAYFTDFATDSDAEKLWEFIHKHVPTAEHVDGGFRGIL